MTHRKHTDTEIIEALERGHLKGMTLTEIAAELGIHRTSLGERQRRLIRKGLWKPIGDASHVVPDGYIVKGKSTYYNDLGQPVATWVKSDLDKEWQTRMMAEAIEGFKSELPKAEPVPAPRRSESDLLNLFVLADAHIGMLAWGDETGGEDYDLEIAEELLAQWIQRAVALAPRADNAILANLGDLLHWDGMEPLTPTSKHVLDADTRFPKLVRAVIRIIRSVVAEILKTHSHLHICHPSGNHDIASTVWIREFLQVHYEDEPRVTVDTSPSSFCAYEFGKTSLFFHHGHKKRGDGLQNLLVGRFREIYGRTLYSYAHSGHLHHAKLEEFPSMIVEQHRTLAPADAHSANSGYMSGREAKVITYSKEWGEVGRISITPGMIATCDTLKVG